MSTLVTIALVALALLPDTPTVRDAAAKLLAQPTVNAESAESSYAAPLIPIRTNASNPDGLSSASWYAVDLTTGVPLNEHEADAQRPIASITKLATALVISRGHRLNDTVTVPTLPAYKPEDATAGFTAGEKFTVRDLLASLLISSDDDAADALAVIDAGGREAFAVKMNNLVSEWGIKDAHFSNPSGLIDTGNQASARAVAQIAALALRNQEIKLLAAQSSKTISDSAGKQFALKTTNDLLQNGRFSGIKTGYTQAAGECFVGLTTIQGHQVLTVVLGSQDRFGDSLKLADWINQTYRWQ